MTIRTTLACLALSFGVVLATTEPAFAARKKKAPAAEAKVDSPAPPAAPPAEPAPPAAPPEPAPEPVAPAEPAAPPGPAPAADAGADAVAAAPAVAAPAKSRGKRGVLLELEPYFDDGTDVRSRKVYGLEQLDPDQQEVGVSRSPAFSVSATFMAPITRLIRLGGGFRYLSSYRYEIDPPEDDPNAEPVEENLGRLVEFFGRAELLVPLVKKLNLVPVLELGLPMLFPAGALKQELDTLEQQGFSVSTGPRLGILVGGDLGVRYELAAWFAVRGGLGIRYERLFLYNASTSDDGGEASRHMNVVRFKPFAGVEFAF